MTNAGTEGYPNRVVGSELFRLDNVARRLSGDDRIRHSGSTEVGAQRKSYGFLRVKRCWGRWFDMDGCYRGVSESRCKRGGRSDCGLLRGGKRGAESFEESVLSTSANAWVQKASVIVRNDRSHRR